MISQFGVFTSFQANVDASGNNILGDAANEPAIAVDPTDRNKMTIGWRQFDSINSDFRQGGWGYTTDAGVTWTFPGVLEPGVFRSDPVTHSDEIGNIFLSQSSVGTIFAMTYGAQPMAAKSWSSRRRRARRRQAVVYHRQDRRPWSRISVPVLERLLPLRQLENSIVPLDGGVTWKSPINLPNDTDTGTLDVDTNGNLLLAAQILAASSGAFARQTHRTEIRHQPLTKTLWSTWVAFLFRAASME